MVFNVKRVLRVGMPLVLIGLVGAAVYLWPREEQVGNTSKGEWTCSMHPQVRRSGPGQCPICGMDLVPVSGLSKEQARLEERAGILTEPIKKRELVRVIRTVGKFDYNERRTAYITARIAGRVDRAYADFTGIQVKKGDHLVDIYSPDLFIAQSELIRALDAMAGARKVPEAFEQSFAETNLEAARTKLRLLGILPDQIEEIERTRKPRTHLTIHAPMGGTVIEKSVRAGQYVKEGDVLYRLADLDPIWLYLELYEYDVGWVRFGQQVDVIVEAYPGEKFKGTVTFIDPFLEERTRTVRARINLSNADRKLKPAMYATASVRVPLRADGSPSPTGLEGKYICPMHPEVVRDKSGRCDLCEMSLEKVPEAPSVQGPNKEKPRAAELKDHPHGDNKHEEHGPECPLHDATKVLAIPVSAVLNTGRRQVAYRRNPDGAFDLVELTLGPRAEVEDEGRSISYYPVLSGLRPGDEVVVRGGFLLDSQRQLEGMPSLLYPGGQGPANLHSGHGEMAPAKSNSGSGHKH